MLKASGYFANTTALILIIFLGIIAPAFAGCPIGYGACAGGGCCPAGNQCASDAKACIPFGAVYCGGGRTCPSGTECGAGGQCLTPCAYGRANDGYCLGEPGSNYCGGGRSCPAGAACSNGGTQCMKPNANFNQQQSAYVPAPLPPALAQVNNCKRTCTQNERTCIAGCGNNSNCKDNCSTTAAYCGQACNNIKVLPDGESSGGPAVGFSPQGNNGAISINRGGGQVNNPFGASSTQVDNPFGANDGGKPKKGGSGNSPTALSATPDEDGCYIPAHDCIEGATHFNKNLEQTVGTYRNRCDKRIYLTMCLQRKNGASDCGADGISAGGSSSYWTTQGTGKTFWSAVGSVIWQNDWVCSGKFKKTEPHYR